MIKALIFDFDGLILDTEVPDYESWQSVFQSYGQNLPVEKWGQIVGGSGASDFDPHSYLESLIGTSVDPEEIWINRRKEYLETVSRQPILPGVVDCLDQARSMKLKLGVASSSSENWVHGHLSRLNLLEYFETVKTADDVIKTKPDPELFQAVLDQFEIRSKQAIVFEDSPNGILAAAAAGIPCVAIPNPLTKQLEFGGADLQLSSLSDMTLDDIIDRIN